MYSRHHRRLRDVLKDKFLAKFTATPQQLAYFAPQPQSYPETPIKDVNADLEQAVYNGDAMDLTAILKYSRANPNHLPGLLHLAILLASKQFEYLKTHYIHDFDFKDYVNGGMDPEVERNQDGDYEGVIEGLIRFGAKQHYKFNDTGFYYAYWNESDPSPYGKTPAEYVSLIINKKPELAENFKRICRILGLPSFQSSTASIMQELQKQDMATKVDSTQQATPSQDNAKIWYKTLPSQIMSTVTYYGEYLFKTLFSEPVEDKQPIENNTLQFRNNRIP